MPSFRPGSPREILEKRWDTIEAAYLTARDAIEDRQFFEDRLEAFLRASFHIVSPGVPFQQNWHISCIADHLEALAKRQIRRLIINLPPRGLKSTLVSVVFPAWRWLHAPEEKFLCASYGRSLALRDSRKCRNLIMSKWYQDRWSKLYGLATDQNEKGRFDNDKGGYRIASSVEGGVLGEGGSTLIMDDPTDLDKMISEPETYPQSVREWYSGTMSSRNIDPRTDVRLCVQQRSSFGGDLTEYLLELGGWEQLVIPNEWMGTRTFSTSLGLTDPRTHLGELYFPARLGPEETALLKREQRNHYAGQFNQVPTLSGKSGLKREWFNFYNPPGTTHTNDKGEPLPVRVTLADGTCVEKVPTSLPDTFEQIVQSWDLAFKNAEANDYVAGHVWGRLGGNCYLLARDHDHRNFPDTLAAIREMSTTFPVPEKLVEDKANGPAVIDTLKNEIPGLIPVNPEGGKWSRVAAVSGYVEAGNVYLPNPDLFPWVWDLLAEFAAGMAAKHDDDTDAMTQALKRLFDGMSRTGVPEFRVTPRLGEPTSARHIVQESPRPDWRRFVACVPGQAILWMAETPSGSLRVTGELDAQKLDARGVGLAIAAGTLPSLPLSGQKSFDLLLPKGAFVELEPEGSWAEMAEHALLTYEPEGGDYDTRTSARVLLREARFRTELVEEEEGAVDRLRGLLAFAPPNFVRTSYDRRKALDLAEKDLAAYREYMGMVDGEVVGEWPKIKIHPSCSRLIQELGTFRTDLPQPPPFVAALLLGVCAPRRVRPREVQEIPWPGTQARVERIRGQSLMSRRYSLGRR